MQANLQVARNPPGTVLGELTVESDQAPMLVWSLELPVFKV